ncbi:MAG: hypothetical protein ACC645_13900 [Pirellulales bacterium]
MRLIVACSHCRRQYEATGREIGSQFRCHCGSAVTVRQPKGHDAKIVCCAGCGAPRNEGTARCGFCGSDFTLHERDLHTVCPDCMTRVSDRGRFCHSCGTQLAPEMTVAEITELSCPTCGPDRRLSNRVLGDSELSVLECGHCAGIWMARGVFTKLVRRVQVEVDPEATTNGRPVRSSPQVQNQTGWKYRACVRCEKLMQRKNYARSGVIVDICSDHGIWFDADELPKLLRWIRTGGGKSSIQTADPGNADSGGRKRPSDRPTDMPTGYDRAPDIWSAVAEVAADVMDTLLRR